MTKKMIEIDDTLQNRVDGAIDEVKQELLNYLEENPYTDKTPCLNNDLDYNGTIHQIVGGSVPVYTNEIKNLWFLHENEFEEAYTDSGIGEDPRENDGMSAIYFYIQQEVNQWYQDNADDIFEEWKEKRLKTEEHIEERGYHDELPEDVKPFFDDLKKDK